jgi:lipid II:glycine glycyltransferase (peptidoglycan interpeptide bridge formation enzyme)
MRGRVLFTEIRANHSPLSERNVLAAHGYEFLDYLNYVIDLTPDPEQLLKNLSKSCRKQVRKCGKAGVRIEVTSSHDAIDKMYKLVQFSYERSRVPLASVQLFHNALDAFGPEVAEVRLARLDGDVVSAGIVLKSHDVMYAWYGGSLRVTGLAPFAALTWHEIESGCREGLRLYDFGGAGWPNEEYGPRDFKSKFGGDLVHHGRYRRINSKLKLRAAKTAYETVRVLKSLIPLR